jgi:hypothetical protein
MCDLSVSGNKRQWTLCARVSPSAVIRGSGPIMALFSGVFLIAHLSFACSALVGYRQAFLSPRNELAVFDFVAHLKLHFCSSCFASGPYNSFAILRPHGVQEMPLSIFPVSHRSLFLRGLLAAKYSGFPSSNHPD